MSSLRACSAGVVTAGWGGWDSCQGAKICPLPDAEQGFVGQVWGRGDSSAGTAGLDPSGLRGECAQCTHGIFLCPKPEIPLPICDS